jgi:anti-sigma regulatory factor (Ser/Thr protein kinase)
VEEATYGRLGRPTAHLLLPCRSDSVPTVRALLHRDLERWDVPAEVADAILLAAGEAVNNAVVHGAWGQQDSVMVVRWAIMTGGKFSFSVTDRGPGFESSRTAMSRRAHPSQNRGRGLYIMHALMDRVVVDSVDRRPHPQLVRQGADLVVRIAPVAPQGPQEGKLAFLGPPGHGLR